MPKTPVDIKSMKIDLNSCIITLSDIYNELNSLKSTTCPGPDNIPYVLFNNCKFVLSIPLLYLFNLSLMSGVFPDKWKVSYILSIPKGGDISLVTNYRPMPCKSTTSNLLVFQNNVLQAFRSSVQVDVIYTDFSKAFDKVDHIALSTKLLNVALRDPFHSWLVSFINGGQQYVKCKSFTSSLFKINSGVP
jgi:hypothetical protein